LLARVRLGIRCREKQLFGVGFRGAGECGDKGGCDYHSNESKADKKIMHGSDSFRWDSVFLFRIIHTMIMTQVPTF